MFEFLIPIKFNSGDSNENGKGFWWKVRIVKMVDWIDPGGVLNKSRRQSVKENERKELSNNIRQCSDLSQILSP
jgi:hypothetical protein